MINADVSIIGPVILDGAGQKRVFSVAASGILTLENLIIQNGYTAGGGGAILASQGGSINISGVSFMGDEADNDGGAINTSGDLSILAANFAGNQAGRRIQGSGFIEGSQAQWNGADRATDYIDENTLAVILTTMNMTSEGVGTITVRNPTPGGGISNASPFTLIRYRYGAYIPLVIR